MAPGRVESNETLDRIEDTMSRSTTRTVGPLTLTVCSPPSRRVAALRPRCAGLTALTPAARTVDRPLLPDRAGTGFRYRLLLTPNTPSSSPADCTRHGILVRGRRDPSDRGEDLGEPGSPVPTRVVTGFIPIQGRDADQQPHGCRLVGFFRERHTRTRCVVPPALEAGASN